jgi:microcystin-dependent protein
MAYKDATNYNTIKSMRGFSIGSIIPWSGEIDTIPTGWIVCSGTTPPTTRYPLLYEVIGNTYGGTPNSTFRIPNLNDGSSAIMDIYRGHFFYLQSGDAAHRPENSNINLDSFWKNVGLADNGNKPSNAQTNWTSTIDVVGQHISRPDVVARHEAFLLSDGDVTFTFSVNERKLSDRHVPSHTHSFESAGAPSYSRRSNLATRNNNYFGSNNFFARCAYRGTPTTVCRSTNDPPKTGTEMSSVGSSRTISTTFRAGGGNIVDDQISWDGQNRATGFSSGDGFSGGNMWAHNSGTRYFFTNLSHSEKSFSQITGHSHGSLEYNWVSKIKLINPGIVSDVKMNNVTIDNSTGINFGTINMNSSTPSCTIIFIIKAF